MDESGGKRFTLRRFVAADDAVTGSKMRVYSHLAGIVLVILSSSLSAGHSIVPMLDIGADEVEDTRNGRDQEVSYVVFRVDSKRSLHMSASSAEAKGRADRFASISSGIRARSIRRLPSVFDTM